MKLISKADVTAAFNVRFPSSAAAAVEGISASAETVDGIEASGVHAYSPVRTKMKTVKILRHVRVGCETIGPDTLVELPESETYGLIKSKRAVEATDAEIAEANKPQKGSK